MTEAFRVLMIRWNTNACTHCNMLLLPLSATNLLRTAQQLSFIAMFRSYQCRHAMQSLLTLKEIILG